MFSKEKYDEETKVASRAIELINSERMEMLIPNTFWPSTLKNIVSLTEGQHYGNMGKKILIKHNVIFLVYAILAAIASPFAWYVTVICIVASLFVINKFRTKSLRNCIRLVALDNPHGFLEAWNRKLFVLKLATQEKIYMHGFDDWKELVNKIDRNQE